MFELIAKRRQEFRRFFVGEGPQTPPYKLTNRRVYILPTRQGVLFSVVLFIMLVGSINYDNSLGYFLTFLLASLAIVSIFHTYRNMLFLQIGPAILKPVFASEPSMVTIQIQNQNYTTRFAIECFLPKSDGIVTDIEENSITPVQLPMTFIKRGLHTLPRFIIQTTFPFGFFRAWSHVELQQEILVYPAPSRDRVLPPHSVGEQDGQKHYTAGNDDFDGLRNYQAGDSFYRIHWKSAARHHVLRTKQYVGNASMDLWINWADSTHPSIEARVSQLTRWVLLADKSGLAYGLRIPKLEIAPANGVRHKERCLKALALYGTEYADTL